MRMLLLLVFYLINFEIGSKIKKTRGPTTCLKTHGLRDDERLPIRLNMYGQPIGCNRAALSTYLGTLARNSHLVPIKYTCWKQLQVNQPEKWADDMWGTVTVIPILTFYLEYIFILMYCDLNIIFYIMCCSLDLTLKNVVGSGFSKH